MPREMPEEKPGDLKLKRLIEKIREAKAKGEDSIIGKMWAYEDWINRPTTSLTSGSLGIAMALMNSSARVDASFKGTVSQETRR